MHTCVTLCWPKTGISFTRARKTIISSKFEVYIGASSLVLSARTGRTDRRTYKMHQFATQRGPYNNTKSYVTTLLIHFTCSMKHSIPFHCQGGYVFTCVCMSVCLLTLSKLLINFLMKFNGMVGHNPGKSTVLDFE